MSTLDPVEARLGALVAALAPAAQAQLAREIARQLRQSQAKRIAAQQNPDGTPFEARKPQLRHKKKALRAGMFAKLRTAKYLKASGNTEEAVVGFTRDVERIARVHQFGLRDRVSRKGALEVEYPARELLGITGEEETALVDRITAHLTRMP